MRRIASQHSIPKSCNTACHCNPKIPLQSHMNFEGFCSSPRHYFFNFPITFGNPEILLQSVWIAKNENWIATGLRNIKTSNFGCSDCTSTSMVQTMSEHTLSRWLQHCPALHWYWGHGHNPPVILIDCARTIWIVYDCENLRNRDYEELPPDLVDCDRISMGYMPTIGPAIQKIASQSTKSGRNRNSGYIGKREDCGVFGDEILVIFSSVQFLKLSPWQQMNSLR